MDEALLRRRIKSAEKAASDLEAALRAADLAMGTAACSPTFARRLWRCLICVLRSIAYYALYLVDMCIEPAGFILGACVIVWILLFVPPRLPQNFVVFLYLILVLAMIISTSSNAPSFLVVGAHYILRLFESAIEYLYLAISEFSFRFRLVLSYIERNFH